MQESEDFMLVSQEIQASISLKYSVSYLSLLPKMSGGKIASRELHRMQS